MQQAEIHTVAPSAPALALAVPFDLVVMLDDWIVRQPHPRPTRSEALRDILESWLAKRSTLVDFST